MASSVRPGRLRWLVAAGAVTLALTAASAVSSGSAAPAGSADISAPSPASASVAASASTGRAVPTPLTGPTSTPASSVVALEPIDDAPGAAPATETTPARPESVAGASTMVPAILPAVPAVLAENPRRIFYGPAEQQFGELWLPRAPTGSALLPVVVLIHGGFWYSSYGLDLMDGLARDLSGRRVAVWNIEYRRIGDPGGGWPGTFDDVGAAVDHLATIALDERLDLGDVTVIGHSAGGHLALWVGGRQRLQADDPGGSPVIVPRVVIGMGPVTALGAAARDRLGSDAVVQLLGGTPTQVPNRYEVATPVAVPGLRMIVVRGSADDLVPARYTLPDPPGDTVVIDTPGENHFHLIDPRSNSWAAVIDVLDLAGR